MSEQLSRRKAIRLVVGAGAAVALVPGVVDPGVAEAAASSQAAPELLGSWRATVTAIDPPLGSFRSLMTFTSGGGFVESRRPYVPVTPFGPILETAGHGRWERAGAHAYRVDFAFLIEGAPDNPTHAGEPLGTDNVHWEPALDGASGVLSGPFQSEARDEDGDLVFAVEGTIVAEPFAP